MEPVTEQELQDLIDRIDHMAPNELKVIKRVCEYNSCDPANGSYERRMWDHLGRAIGSNL